MEYKSDWYRLQDPSSVDSPALLIYRDRVVDNIAKLIAGIDRVDRLRPHIKTHKSPEVCRLMLDAGIRKFKCATIAEAEMLAAAGATDVLLAYQPVGPRIQRLMELIDEFGACRFSCLVDDLETASAISSGAVGYNVALDVYIDLNVGMNRTGIVPAKALALVQACAPLRGIRIAGLHAYDGHLRDRDYETRKKNCDAAFAAVETLQQEIALTACKKLPIIAGGTPTFSIHCKRSEVECSPGTFIYWDKGYDDLLPEQDFEFAALIMARVISKPAENIICTDLGHKAIASENPITQRVYFLNAPDLEPVGHSEEHMVFRSSRSYNIGDVLYGVPHHICPTVALYDQAVVVVNQSAKGHWFNISRNRKITI